jgi:hypothetical protein
LEDEEEADSGTEGGGGSVESGENVDCCLTEGDDEREYCESVSDPARAKRARGMSDEEANHEHVAREDPRAFEADGSVKGGTVNMKGMVEGRGWVVEGV